LSEKERSEYGFVESPWGREPERGSSHPFSSRFKKRSDQKGKLFDTHEDFAVISPHYIFFGISMPSSASTPRTGGDEYDNIDDERRTRITA
jgi:hypothetical protein